MYIGAGVPDAADATWQGRSGAAHEPPPRKEREVDRAMKVDRAEQLRVALFSGNYNMVRDGANGALNRLVARLLERGAQARVYSPAIENPAFPATGTLVPVPSVPIPGRSEYRVSFGLGAGQKADLDAFRPNVIHLSAPEMIGRAAMRYARERDLPVVASLHTRFETYLDFYHMGFLRPLAERYLGSFYGSCDLVFTPNGAMGKSVTDAAPGTRTAVWSRGVNRQVFNPDLRDMEWRRAQGIADDQMVVLFFGRLVKEKGTALFAKIIAELRRRGAPIVPLVVGEGPERERMTAALDGAIMAGHLEAADLGRAIASSDILVNPSVTEAFCNVNLEAMAAGLSVISADVPVAREMFRDGQCGLLVQPDDVRGFADAIEGLIADPTRRATLIANALDAASTYHWDGILDSVIDGYFTVLDNANSGAGSSRA